jgi:hypothetical protein
MAASLGGMDGGRWPRSAAGMANDGFGPRDLHRVVVHVQREAASLGGGVGEQRVGGRCTVLPMRREVIHFCVASLLRCNLRCLDDSPVGDRM